MIDKKELRRLAEAATEGEWKRNKVFGQLSIQDDNYMLGDADAVFIAAADPAAILSLLDELEACKEDADRYRWICNDNGYFLEEEGLRSDKAMIDAAIDRERATDSNHG